MLNFISLIFYKLFRVILLKEEAFFSPTYVNIQVNAILDEDRFKIVIWQGSNYVDLEEGNKLFVPNVNYKVSKIKSLETRLKDSVFSYYHEEFKKWVPVFKVIKEG